MSTVIVATPVARQIDRFHHFHHVGDVTADALTEPTPAADTPGRQPFAMTPMSVITDPRISRDALALYALLDGRQGGHASVRVKVPTLAADLRASDKSVRRWLDELRSAGHLHSQQTGRSLKLTVVNPSRQAPSRPVTGDRTEPRSVTSDRSDRSRVTDLQIHKREIQTTASAQTEPTHQPPATPAGAAETDTAYLAAIKAATGVALSPTGKVRQHLAAIRRSGITAADTAAIAAAYLAMHGEQVQSPARWLAGFVLDAIGRGERPQQLPLFTSRSEASSTAQPPRYADQLAAAHRAAQQQATPPPQSFKDLRQKLGV